MLVRVTPTAAAAELRQPASLNESGAVKSSEFGAWLRKQRSTETTSEGQRAARSADDGPAKKSAEETPPARTSEDAEVRSQSQQSRVVKSDETVTKSDMEKGASAETDVKSGAKTDVGKGAEKKRSTKKGVVVRGDVPRSRELKTTAGDKRKVDDEPERARGKSVQAQDPSGSERSRLRSKDEAAATKVALRGAVHARGSSQAKETASKENAQADMERIDDSASRPHSGEATEFVLTGGAESSRETGEESEHGESTSLKETAAKTDSRGRALKNGGSRQDSSPVDSDGKTESRQTPVADVREEAKLAREDAEKFATPEQVRSPSEAGTKPVHLRASAQVADSKGPSASADTGRVSTTPVRVDVSAPAPSDANGAPLKSTAPFHQLVEQGLDQLLSSPQGTMVRQLQLQLSGAQSAHIRLSLQPESLGEVRLFVQLHDRNAVTQIKVDNAQAGQLMEGALESFARSFSDSGYQQQRFEVVVEQRHVAQQSATEGLSSAGARPLAQVWFDQQQVNYMA